MSSLDASTTDASLLLSLPDDLLHTCLLRLDARSLAAFQATARPTISDHRVLTNALWRHLFAASSTLLAPPESDAKQAMRNWTRRTITASLVRPASGFGSHLPRASGFHGRYLFGCCASTAGGSTYVFGGMTTPAAAAGNDVYFGDMWELRTSARAESATAEGPQMVPVHDVAAVPVALVDADAFDAFETALSAPSCSLASSSSMSPSSSSASSPSPPRPEGPSPRAGCGLQALSPNLLCLFGGQGRVRDAGVRPVPGGVAPGPVGFLGDVWLGRLLSRGGEDGGTRRGSSGGGPPSPVCCWEQWLPDGQGGEFGRGGAEGEEGKEGNESAGAAGNNVGAGVGDDGDDEEGATAPRGRWGHTMNAIDSKRTGVHTNTTGLPMLLVFGGSAPGELFGSAVWLMDVEGRAWHKVGKYDRLAEDIGSAIRVDETGGGSGGLGLGGPGGGGANMEDSTVNAVEGKSGTDEDSRDEHGDGLRGHRQEKQEHSPWPWPRSRGGHSTAVVRDRYFLLGGNTTETSFNDLWFLDLRLLLQLAGVSSGEGGSGGSGGSRDGGGRGLWTRVNMSVPPRHPLLPFLGGRRGLPGPSGSASSSAIRVAPPSRRIGHSMEAVGSR